MNILPVVARIKDQCPAFVSVSRALSLEPTEGIKAYPACWVYPAEDEVSDYSGVGGGVSGLVFSTFAVIVAAQDRTGSTLDGLREIVEAALVAWVPDSGYAPIKRLSGSILELSGETVWWQDNYQTTLLVNRR